MTRTRGANAVSPLHSRPITFSEKTSVTLPPANSKIVSYPAMVRKIESDPVLRARREKIIKSTAESLFSSLLVDEDGRPDQNKMSWYKKNGLDYSETQGVVKAVSEHVADMMMTQAEHRPGLLKKIAKYGFIFDDLGNMPIEAIVDHDSKVVVLDKKRFMSKASKDALSGRVLSAVTHEMSHIIDHELAPGLGNAAFTEMFRPLHEHLAKYDDRKNVQKWLLDSGLAYPLNGYYGITTQDGLPRELGKEYVSVLSELYWTSPKYIDQIDAKLVKDGYNGPLIRECMQRVWGGVDITTSRYKIKNTPQKIDLSTFPIKNIHGERKLAYSNKFDAGNSDKDWQKYVTLSPARG